MKIPAALPALLLAVALAGCGGQTGAGATSPAVVSTPPPQPPPIPVVEPSCIAEHPQYASTADVVEDSDAIVRGRAVDSRDHDLYPDPPSGSDPAVNPQHGVPHEEIDEIPPMPATALSITVTEVVKGDLAVGQVIEVNQNACTSRPLPVGQDSDYVLALNAPSGQGPWNQLNDSHAAWQVSGERALTPVNPDDGLDVGSIDELDAEVAAQAPPG